MVRTFPVTAASVPPPSVHPQSSIRATFAEHFFGLYTLRRGIDECSEFTREATSFKAVGLHEFPYHLYASPRSSFGVPLFAHLQQHRDHRPPAFHLVDKSTSVRTPQPGRVSPVRKYPDGAAIPLGHVASPTRSSLGTTSF